MGLTISSWSGSSSEELKQECEEMISDGWNGIGVLQVFLLESSFLPSELLVL